MILTQKEVKNDVSNVNINLLKTYRINSKKINKQPTEKSEERTNNKMTIDAESEQKYDEWGVLLKQLKQYKRNIQYIRQEFERK